MPAVVVVGAQWGDEGKGKVVHLLAALAHLIARWGGGCNAGHTIYVDGIKCILHLLPCGITIPGKTNLMGPGVLCDLAVLQEELAIAAKFGATVFLDPDAHIVLDIHKLLDGATEQQAGANKIGTTGRGIGPAASDRAARVGVRLRDLHSDDAIRAALLRRGFYEERRAIARHRGVPEDMIPDLDATVAELSQYRDLVMPLLRDTRQIIAEALEDNKLVLIEGAQGVGLDRYVGTFPFVTATECTVGGMSSSLGVYWPQLTQALGVAKAYLTRVGAGPFPTRMDPKMEALIRERGQEFGATTGRPRDCGWLDLVQLRHNCRVGGITGLVITKLDILSGMGPIKVCTWYRDADGTEFPRLGTLTTEVMERCTPHYITVPGWPVDNEASWKSFSDLPGPAREYLQLIANHTRVPVLAVSVGPHPEQYFPVNVKPMKN